MTLHIEGWFHRPIPDEQLALIEVAGDERVKTLVKEIRYLRAKNEALLRGGKLAAKTAAGFADRIDQLVNENKRLYASISR